MMFIIHHDLSFILSPHLSVPPPPSPSCAQATPCCIGVGPGARLLLRRYCELAARRPRCSHSSSKAAGELQCTQPLSLRSFPPSSEALSMGNINEGVVKDELTLRDKDAVIIVDHGSRRQESNLLLNEFVAMFRGRTGHGIVKPAHMEIVKPSIVDAFKLCVQQGANRVIISPFFLSPGRHWNQDIPALAAEAAREHPGISYIVTAPLGLHELLVDVMKDRIKHCLSHVAGDADECDVCAGTGKCCLR